MANQTKDLNTRLTGDSASLENAMRRGGRAMSQAEREARKLEAQQRRTEQAMDKLGKGMLAAGAAIGAGLALSVRAAIQWESAWTGVAKVLDATPAQLEQLEGQLRGLARELPQSHEEIAAVAAAAGQLGVATEDVVDFTRTMIDLGESTNLSSEQAAFALARMMNIMQTAPDAVSRLGSTIVDLGNNSATTEADIVEMALRIAGAGRTIGLSEHQVLSFSAALSSVGIAAESGGTAFSKVILEIDKATKTGGERLDTFARVAGQSADTFARAYRENAGDAIASFISGLGRMQATGGDINATLAELGFTEVRVSDALRRLAGSGDLLTRSLRVGSTAWQENSALAAEAERRYATTEARMAIARNQINDFAITMGQTFLPVVGRGADMIGSLSDVISDLPAPMRTALAILAALAGGVALVGGSALVAVPRMHAMSQAMDQMAAAGGRAATMVTAFRAVSSFLTGPWGIAIGLGITALTAFGLSQASTRARVEELAATLDEQTGSITGNTRAWVAHELETRGMLERAQRLGLDLMTVTDAVIGQDDAVAALNSTISDHIVEVGQLERHMDAYAQRLIEGGAETDEFGRLTLDSAGKLADYRRQLVLNDRDARELQGTTQGLMRDVAASVEAHERQRDAVGETGAAMAQADPQARELAEVMGLTTSEAEDLSAAVDQLDKELQQLLTQLFGVEEAEDAAAQAMRKLTEEAADSGASLDGNSEAALTNRANVRALVRADLELIQALAETGATSDELSAKTDKLRKRFVEQMRQAGFTGEAIEEYAAAYDEIPSRVKTTFSTPGLSEAERRVRNLALAVDHIPSSKHIQLTASVAAPALGRNVAFQHGGWVPGHGPPDSVVARVSPGEFVVRREVAQANPALMEAINAGGGRMPVGASTAAAAGGGMALGGGGGTVRFEHVHRFTSDGSAAGRFVAEGFRHQVRTNATFKADVKRAAT